MTESNFEFTVKREDSIHMRPLASLVKSIVNIRNQFPNLAVNVSRGNATADATKLLDLLILAGESDPTCEVKVNLPEGNAEFQSALEKVRDVFKEIFG